MSAGASGNTQAMPLLSCSRLMSFPSSLTLARVLPYRFVRRFDQWFWSPSTPGTQARESVCFISGFWLLFPQCAPFASKKWIAWQRLPKSSADVVHRGQSHKPFYRLGSTVEGWRALAFFSASRGSRLKPLPNCRQILVGSRAFSFASMCNLRRENDFCPGEIRFCRPRPYHLATPPELKDRTVSTGVGMSIGEDPKSKVSSLFAATSPAALQCALDHWVCGVILCGNEERTTISGKIGPGTV
jgi:hypothetical protein